MGILADKTAVTVALIDTLAYGALLTCAAFLFAGIVYTIVDLIARGMWRREQNKRIGKDV